MNEIKPMSNEELVSKLRHPGIIWLYRVLGLVLLGAVACRTSDTSASGAARGRPAGSKWEIGAPIVHYYQGPGGYDDLAMTPANARKLADGGFNLVWCRTEDELDAAHAQGLRGFFYAQKLKLGDPKGTPGMLDDPVRRQKLGAMIDRVKNHPAMYGYYVYDEPGAALFPMLARLVAFIRERDPHHMAFINLFPCHASAAALGTAGDMVTAYREHLRQFLDIVKPDAISYDHFHFKATDRPYDGHEYFLNLALVREAALKGGLPFINAVQACALGPGWRAPNGDEGRFLAYTTLAYGGQGISQFAYKNFRGGQKNPCCPIGGVANEDGTLTPLGEALRQINPEFVAIGGVLQPLISLGAYHLGTVPLGALGLPADARFTVDPPVPPAKFGGGAPVKGMLLGYFGANGNPTHVLVVNLDYTRAITTTVIGPEPLEVFNATSRTWSAASGGSRAQVSLLRGGGKLMRLAGLQE